MKPVALANLTFTGISVKGDKDKTSASVLFDTGATFSIISQSLAEKIASIVDADKPLKIALGDKSTVQIDKMCLAMVDLGGRVITDHFYVMENAITDVILGMSTMRKYQMRIDAGQDQVFASITEAKEKFSMKDFLKKLFATLGISANAEETTEDKAVELVAARLEAIKAEGKTPEKKEKKDGIVIIPVALLKALKLPEDASESDAIAAAHLMARPLDPDSREQLEELSSKVLERDVQDLVNKACAAGDDDMSAKLLPNERNWALEFARDNFEAAQKFIKQRPKVLAVMSRLPGKKEKGVVIDDTQRAINAQLKVSDETFKKYNAPIH